MVPLLSYLIALISYLESSQTHRQKNFQPPSLVPAKPSPEISPASQVEQAGVSKVPGPTFHADSQIHPALTYRREARFN
jgi:hypothetical protein